MVGRVLDGWYLIISTAA